MLLIKAEYNALDENSPHYRTHIVNTGTVITARLWNADRRETTSRYRVTAEQCDVRKDEGTFNVTGLGRHLFRFHMYCPIHEGLVSTACFKRRSECAYRKLPSKSCHGIQRMVVVGRGLTSGVGLGSKRRGTRGRVSSGRTAR